MYYKKRFNVELRSEAEHTKVQSLLQKENYSQLDFQNLVIQLINDNFLRVNNIRKF
jgi:hypothetical protein